MSITFLGLGSIAQTDTNKVTDWKLYPKSDVKSLEDTTAKVSDTFKTSGFKSLDDSTQYFSADQLEATGKSGHLNISKDSRIDEILEFLGSSSPAEPVRISGYRVQVFFDQNRDLALGEKAKFMSLHPKTKAYMEWDAPNHYVRVGNYYTKQQALALIEELKGAFPTATVIQCKIELPELDLDTSGSSNER